MIQKTNVTEQIVAYYKQQILNGTWKVGEKIPSENQLCGELGVSRASIRSAVKELIGLGVLESMHGKGTFLIDDLLDAQEGARYKITAQDCMDMGKVLEFRRIVEPEACYLAAVHMTDELLKELDASFRVMRENITNSVKFVTADLRFHRAISKASENPLIEKSLNRLFDENLKDHQKMNQVFGYQDGIYYHSMILEALRGENADRARQIMFDHMQHGIDRLREMDYSGREPENTRI